MARLRAYGFDGPVAILGFYNPQAELLPGSNALQEALNGNLEATVKSGAFGPGVKVASIFSTFNPETSPSAEHRSDLQVHRRVQQNSPQRDRRR